MIRTLFFGLLWLGPLAVQAQSPCNCPPPTPEQFSRVCAAVYRGDPASNPDWEDVGFRWVEELWKMSCATPGVDTEAQAAVKIQCMWNKYRESFRCYGYTGSAASEMNITKFATDIGRDEVLGLMLRKLHLDMNFRDPYDGQTVLDFVIKRKRQMEGEIPRNEPWIVLFQNVIDRLRKYGAKTSQELGK